MDGYSLKTQLVDQLQFNNKYNLVRRLKRLNNQTKNNLTNTRSELYAVKVVEVLPW